MNDMLRIAAVARLAALTRLVTLMIVALALVSLTMAAPAVGAQAIGATRISDEGRRAISPEIAVGPGRRDQRDLARQGPDGRPAAAETAQARRAQSPFRDRPLFHAL